MVCLFYNENMMFNHNDVSTVLLDGRVQFHIKSAIFQSQYLYQIFNYPTIQWVRLNFDLTESHLTPVASKTSISSASQGQGHRDRNTWRERKAQVPSSGAVHVRPGGTYPGGTYTDLVSSVWPLTRRQSPISPLPFASPGCFFQSHPICQHYCIMCTSSISNELELIQIKTFCFVSFVSA